MGENLGILCLQVLESVVRLHVGFLFDHVGYSLLHLHSLFLVEDELLFLFLLGGDEELLFVDLAVEGQPWPLLGVHHACDIFFVAIKAEGWKGTAQRKRLSIGLLEPLGEQNLLLDVKLVFGESVN